MTKLCTMSGAEEDVRRGNGWRSLGNSSKRSRARQRQKERVIGRRLVVRMNKSGKNSKK